MPVHKLTFRCLLISPSDVQPERDAIEAAVLGWNAHVGAGLEAAVEVVRWESHARPDMSGPPQDVINRQLVDACDFGIAIFWARLGSPTTKHPSGSAEEVEQLLARGSNVMVYFSSAPIPQERLRDDQFDKLQELRRSYVQRGLLATYDTIEGLTQKVILHVTSLVAGLLTKARAGSQPIPSTGTLTAPKPDIRVSVQGVFAGQVDMGAFLAVEIQNHSPADFFFSSLMFALSNGNRLFIAKDVVRGDHIMPRKLSPGDGFTVLIDPNDIKETLAGATLVNAIVKDKIDRLYVSDPEATERALLEWAANARVAQRRR